MVLSESINESSSTCFWDCHSTSAADKICTECVRWPELRSAIGTTPHAGGNRDHPGNLASCLRRQVLPCKLRIHTHTLIAPPQFPRHGTQDNGIQSTAEAMA